MRQVKNREAENCAAGRGARSSRLDNSFFWVGMVSASFILGSAILFGIIYGGIITAYCIGDSLDSEWLGFALVPLGYLLMAAVAWIFRKKLHRLRLLESLVRNFLAG